MPTALPSSWRERASVPPALAQVLAAKSDITTRGGTWALVACCGGSLSVSLLLQADSNSVHPTSRKVAAFISSPGTVIMQKASIGYELRRVESCHEYLPN
jgi:hypothetical protein